MDKEEIALQLTLKSLEKFKLDKASQVAEIYNIIYRTLRIGEENGKETLERAPKASAKEPAPRKPREQRTNPGNGEQLLRQLCGILNRPQETMSAEPA